MSTEYGAVKVSLAKEIHNLASIRDVDAALGLLRRFGATLAGDRSSSSGWPKITKCIPRDTMVAFDAHGTAFDASMSFDISNNTREHTYMLKSGTPRKVETGRVEHATSLSDAAMREPNWMNSPAYALAAYRHRFVVFTRADAPARTERAWLVGINELSAQ
jgi:hypothetical protein